MGFCLPQQLADKFIKALKDGVIDPAKLADMTSAERRTFFEKIVGKDAKEVNALFESKLLLKNQQAGMITWAKKVAGITEAARTDLISKIQRMDKVLTAADKESFLNDLASKKLKTEVTFGEAKNITQLAKKASEADVARKDTAPYSVERLQYGRNIKSLNDYIESIKPQGGSLRNKITNVLNIPKTALTSVLHFSAPFVQGWGMLGRASFYKGFVEQFKYFASPEAYNDLHASIIGHPDYEAAMKAKLGLTNMGDKLSMREEAIQSSLLQRIPGIGKLVKSSSRAFTGFLNYVRFNEFSNLLHSAGLKGEDISVGSKVSKDIASVVNNFSGRGSLGDRFNNITPELNALFFSPRKIAGTIQMFNPIEYMKLSPTARAYALRNISGSLIATGAVLTLAHLAGAKVETNPTSTNFGKAQWGNTTLDMTGGNAIYLRLLARLFSGQYTSSAGKTSSLTSGKYGAQTRLSTAESFLRDKLSPIASTVADLMAGTDAVGQPVTVSSELKDKLTPIVLDGFINLIQNDPKNSAVFLPALASIFGVSMQSTKQKK